MVNGPFLDGLPIKVVIFYNYVKLPEGMFLVLHIVAISEDT